MIDIKEIEAHEQKQVRDIKAWTKLLSIVLFLFISPVFYSIYMEGMHNDCGLEVEDAKSKIMSYLSDHSLPLENLSGPEDQIGTCYYYFSYKGNGNIISFEVTSSWADGVELAVN